VHLAEVGWNILLASEIHVSKQMPDAIGFHIAEGAPPPSPSAPLLIGDHLVDFVLPDHQGNRRRLSELVGGDPAILQFYRGFWCPKDQAHFRRLVQLQDQVEVAYTRMISVSVDPPEVEAAFRAGIGARWTFLSDTARELQAQLGLLETTDTVHRPYVPTVFTLFPDLKIHSIYNGYWFWGRPSNAELAADLRAITRAVRADWEVPTR
jgi:peroxiredoxin